MIECRFEDWTPSAERFALVFAATAWHWVAPEVRYVKAAQALEDGGHLAFWSATHVLPYDGDLFFEQIQPLYDEIGEAVPDDHIQPRPQQLPDSRVEIEASGLFRVIDVSQFDWEVTYDVDGYLALLSTFSGHITMQTWQRERLYGEIRRRLAERPDGRLRRHWGAVLHLAVKIGA